MDRNPVGHENEPIRVLHVDDEPDFAELSAAFLKRHHESFQIATETNVTDALTHLESETFDCVVSDYEMPGTNGLEFLEQVRDRFEDLPFILFTGKGSEEIASLAISAGVSDYLQKETGTEQYAVLANRIQNAVSKYRSEQLVDRAFRAMDRSREGIALLDDDGEFIYVNQAYSEITGYDRDDLIGGFWERVYPEGQIKRIYEEILPDVPEVGFWTGETVYQRKNGDRILVDHAIAYSDEGTMICLIRDITDAEGRRQALQAERQRFDLFIDAVEDYAIFMLDPDGYITSWNKGAERIKGYTEDEILGEHFSIFYPDDAKEKNLPSHLLEQALANGSVKDTGPRVRKDGSTFHANVVITAIYDEDGTLRGFGKVTQDESSPTHPTNTT